MTMKLWHFALRSFLVSFIICQGYSSRVVYFTIPSSNVQTILKAAGAVFGVELNGRTPIESRVAMAEPPMGCSELTNGQALSGKIVLVDRGNCYFQDKAMKIQKAGGLAGIVIDNNPGLSARNNNYFVMHSGHIRDEVTIPMVFLFDEEAKVLLSARTEYPDLVVGVADVAPVAVNGHWSNWTEWSLCPVTCGTGEIRRSRLCNNPPPSHGGSNCTGNSTEEEMCYTDIACPAPQNQESGERSESAAGDETQMTAGHISLIAISAIILVIVSAVAIYYFCPRGENATWNRLRFSELKD